LVHPRKFKLAKSTSKERIYTEIPPPVAPKPKQKLFRGLVYTSEENMYIEMKKSISNSGTMEVSILLPQMKPDILFLHNQTGYQLFPKWHQNIELVGMAG
jgi:hypothetical protein